MGWLGSDSVLPSGRSTGTRNFANAAYSSGGSCDSIRLRGRAGFNGFALWVVGTAPSLCRGKLLLWPQRRVAHNWWGVDAVSNSLGRLRADVCAIQGISVFQKPFILADAMGRVVDALFGVSGGNPALGPAR